MDPIRTLAKIERKNPNYVLVRFPIDLIAQQLEEWFAEEINQNEYISQVEIVKIKKENMAKYIKK